MLLWWLCLSLMAGYTVVCWPLNQDQLGFWKLVVTEANQVSGYMVKSGTPFLGQLQSVGIEDTFSSVGQLFNDLPKEEYVLEAVTENGFQVLLSTVSGNRYGLVSPPHLGTSGQSLGWNTPLAPPTMAAPTMASPTMAAPTMAAPTIASPTMAAPTMAAPKMATPAVVTSMLESASVNPQGNPVPSQRTVPVVQQRDDGVLSFSNHVELDIEGRYHMSWVSGDKGISFKLEVETLGYVGLGFSPTGGMAGADIVIAWVDDDDGRVHLTDRHGLGNFIPPLDTSQDLQLQMGYQNDTHTVIQFYRVWDTCDEDDAILGLDTVRVIWSYHQEDRLQYHTFKQRGVKSIDLGEPLKRKSQSTTLEAPKVWDMTAGNVTIPNTGTTHYFCKIFKLPGDALKSKHQLIALEPLVQPGNERYVHHLTVKACVAPMRMGGSEAVFDQYVDHPGAFCYTADAPPVFNLCLITFIGWALGNNGIILPSNIGYPLGEEFGGSTYFKFEMHYDNPDLHTGIIDNSGIRWKYTDQLRNMDAGTIYLGLETNILHMVPPLQTLFKSTGFCPAECTRRTLPEDGIRVFMWLPHTHLAGRRVRVRQVRDGMELPLLLEDNYYDSNFQSTRVLNSEMLVLPGDTLIAECDYNTTERASPTYGGLGTTDEMCRLYVMYYPKTDLAGCFSGASFSTFMKSLGIEQWIGESFEKLLSFTFQEQLRTENSWNLSDVIASVTSELDLDDETVGQLMDTSFYRDWHFQTEVLFKMIKKIRITAPAHLEGRTVGNVFDMMNWVEEGPDISNLLTTEEHRCHCSGQDSSPLIEFQPHKIPDFIEIETKEDNCKPSNP